MGKVAILDFGAQYTKVIDRRVRELQVESDILPSETPIEHLKEYDALILSGGPHSVFEETAPSYDPRLFELNKPMLGICYGMQLMNHALGGIVRAKDRKEYGETQIVVENSLLFKRLKKAQQVLMSHGDSINILAPNFTAIAYSNNIIAAIENSTKRYYGVQFHPEVDLTANGKQMLANFLFRICHLQPTFSMERRIERTLYEIRKTIGNKKVLVLVSGGVDSAVTAVLLLKALKPKQVYALHIDHGFMRKNESKRVCIALKNLGLKKLSFVQAYNDFSKAKRKNGKRIETLETTTDPETKREIIGDMFMKVVDREINKLKLPKDTFLAQGTLRPDLIESASELVSSTANKIKTHHNDSELVRLKRKKGLVMETNKDWHKDEVKQVGVLLGLPKEIIQRQPFPGPGLAVRILCATKTYTKNINSIAKEVKKIALQHGLNAAVLPIRSVGVQGDHRSYRYVAVLSGRGHYPTLKKVADEIPRVVHDINRVVYLFEQHVNGAIQKITPTTLTKDVLNQLREADAIVNEKLAKYNLIAKFSQVPVVLLPVSFNGGNRSIVIRPFITNDFMTGRAARFGSEIPIKCLKEIVQEISTVRGIGAVLYDLTSKPPGTTEWE
jgi:GMP synthase (glutamine-hydrolysing)